MRTPARPHVNTGSTTARPGRRRMGQSGLNLWVPNPGLDGGRDLGCGDFLSSELVARLAGERDGLLVRKRAPRVHVGWIEVADGSLVAGPVVGFELPV